MIDSPTQEYNLQKAKEYVQQKKTEKDFGKKKVWKYGFYFLMDTEPEQ